MPQPDIARRNMIEGQLRPNKITDDALIDALAAIPREEFVPRAMQRIAYIDGDIALGGGRYLPEPMILAGLIQAAQVKKTDIVLDIGCGTGYASAVLGHLAGTVVAIDRDPVMVQAADKLLHDLDICNAAAVTQANLRAGYAQQGPYDVILINGAVNDVPLEIKKQLAEGGRLVAVLSRNGRMGNAIMITRKKEGLLTETLFDAAAPLLAGFETPDAFKF